MKKTVLIVDDNAPTLQLLSGILTGAGYETIICENGEEALEAADKNQIHCALIDQYMDPMDGFTLARGLKVDGHNFPLAMITANDGGDLLLESQRNGFMTIIIKPIEPERLLKIVARMTR